MGLGAAIVGASAIGAGASIIGSQNASGAETSAAGQASQTQLQMYDQTRSDLSGYNSAGESAENQLMYGLGLTSGAPTSGGYGGAASSPLVTGAGKGDMFAGTSESGITADQANGILSSRPDVLSAYNALPGDTKASFGSPQAYAAYWFNRYGSSQGYQLPSASGGSGGATSASSAGIGQNSLIANFAPTEAQLQQTPGYQFTLSQGLKSTQSAAAARGLGSSGAALKGASTYATGLADSTYQNQFNNFQTQQTNNFNRLLGLTSLGENAAAQTGNYGTQTAANIGNNITGAGTATAAADTAAGSQISGLANNLGSAYLTNSLMGSSGGGGLYGGQAATGESVYQDGLI